MNKRMFWFVSGVLALALILAGGILSARADDILTPEQELGKQLFFDVNLSANNTQSCATCHAPEVSFVGPDSAINVASGVYPGALPNHFGNRKPPTAAYGGYSPIMYFDELEGLWIGACSGMAAPPAGL